MQLKNLCWWVLMAMAALACEESDEKARLQQKQELSIGWNFKPTDSLEWMPAKVPATVFTNLRVNKQAPSVLESNAWKKLGWVDNHTWIYTYRLKLDSAQQAMHHHLLRMKGLPAGSEILVDDQVVGRASSLLRVLNLDLSGQLKQAKHLLKVRIPASDSLGMPYLQGGRHLPNLPAAGMYQLPELIHWQGMHLLQQDLQHNEQGAELVFDVYSAKKAQAQFQLQVRSVGQELNQQQMDVELPPGKSTLKFKLPSTDLPQWNPFGRGYQEQLDLVLQGTMDSVPAFKDTLYAGFCRWKLREGYWRHPEQPKLPLRTCVWNSIRPDFTQARENDYFNRLYALRKAGYNTLLVDYQLPMEQPQFYEMCSRYGLMVLHQWPEGVPDSLVTSFYAPLQRYTCFRGLVVNVPKEAELNTYVLEEKDIQVLPPMLEYEASHYGAEQELGKPNLVQHYGFEESAIMQAMHHYQSALGLQGNAYRFELRAAQQLRRDFSRGKNLVAGTKPFPALSAALTNYEGQPTAPLYEAAKFHKPLFAQAQRKGYKISIAIGNNNRQSLRDYKVRISRFPTNKTYAPEVMYENRMLLAEGITKVMDFTLRQGEDSTDFGILVEVEDDLDSLQLTQALYLCDWENLALMGSPPVFTLWEYEGIKGYLHLQSNVLVKNVRLSHPNPEFYFEENYFDLVPGHPKTIEFLLPEASIYSELKSGIQVQYLNPTTP